MKKFPTIDPATLVNLIERASTPDQNIQAQAMKELEMYDRATGFLGGLLAIIEDNIRFTLQQRTLSSICLRNLVRSYWRPRPMNQNYQISQDDRILLRKFCITHVSDTDRGVTAQLCTLTAQLVRKDWPDQWPDALQNYQFL